MALTCRTICESAMASKARRLLATCFALDIPTKVLATRG